MTATTDIAIAPAAHRKVGRTVGGPFAPGAWGHSRGAHIQARRRRPWDVGHRSRLWFHCRPTIFVRNLRPRRASRRHGPVLQRWVPEQPGSGRQRRMSGDGSPVTDRGWRRQPHGGRRACAHRRRFLVLPGHGPRDRRCRVRSGWGAVRVGRRGGRSSRHRLWPADRPGGECLRRPTATGGRLLHPAGAVQPPPNDARGK